MLKLLIPFFFFFFFKNIFWDMMFLFMIIILFLNFYLPSLYMNNLNYMYYLDNLSYGLLFLSFWIIFLMFLSMEKFYFNKNFKLNSFFTLLLLLFLMMSFLSNSLLMFYIFFEMSLIPTLYLILGWGYQPERIQAGVYLLFYTLLASLPMLLGILFIYMEFKIINFNFMFKLNYMFLYYSMIIAFLVKMPMFLVHLWLPKAHVEAPISGSMILAGVLLKLGGYGLIRIYSYFMLFNFNSIIWLSISMYGGFLISLNCLRQIDLKSLIAYSSVAHMGMVIAGIMTMTYWGINGGYLMMIAHGLCSSGLFCLANISYDRMLSRSMMINKGMMNYMPTMSLWWFLLCSSNMSSPLSLNLLSEISLINSLIMWSWLNMILVFLLCFFSASYSLYLYSFSQHGMLFSGVYSFSNGMFREYLMMMMHWLPLNLLFLKMMNFYI